MPRNVDVDHQEFARLWEEGLSIDRIAERFDIHRNTVLRKACEMKLPKRARQVDVPMLFRLWGDMTLTRVEVARQLGLTEGNLTRLAARYGLGPRGRQHRAFSMDDPTPEDDAASANSLEIAPSLRDACEAAKQRHFAQRRAETATATDSKLSKRRARCGA